MRASSQGSYLLLLRSGGVWGVTNEAVLGVGRQRSEYHIQILSQSGSAHLVADEVLGIVDGLEVWPPAKVLRRFWSETSGGMAVHGGAPILVVDPDRPPRTLMFVEALSEEGLSEQGEEWDGTTH